MSVSTTWKTYDDFIEGAAANRLPRTEALVGRTLDIACDAASIHLRFEAPDHVAWSDGRASGSEWCEVIEVAPSVFFIDLTFREHPRDALTVIADLNSRRVLQVLSVVREEDTPGEPKVAQSFHRGVLSGGEATGAAPSPTRDLIGLRTFNVYSPNHTYEHIYLSAERYCWQCLVGVQRGHGDVDMASTWRFAEDQYVFTFREFKIPVASVFFLNFRDLRSTGKFLGITAAGAVSNEPAGAFITKASMTLYPEGAAPV